MGNSDVYMEASSTGGFSNAYEWNSVGTPIEKALVQFLEKKFGKLEVSTENDQRLPYGSVRDHLRDIATSRPLLARLPFDQGLRRKVSVR